MVKADKWGLKRSDYVAKCLALKGAVKQTDAEIGKAIKRVLKTLRDADYIENYCYDSKGDTTVFGMRVGDAIEVWIGKNCDQLVFD